MPAPPSPGAIEVHPVSSRQERRDFVRVPWRVYAGDAHWVPPLVLERLEHLSRRNPYFQHARAALFVAYRDGRPVGRISAQVDALHLERYGDATGFFGFLEAADDPAVFAALFAAAERWLRQQGMRRAIGPFSFSINDEIGMLVEGFDAAPMFMMPHGRPYYDVRVGEQGYRKAKDVVAYLLDPAIRPPPVMGATVQKAGGGRIRVRTVRLKQLDRDVAILRDLFNDAWSGNWNSIPFTDAEMKALGRLLKLFVPPEYVLIAELDGEPAAMLVAVPNINEAIRDLDGRLVPFGWARLLWRLKRTGVRSARVPLMGMRRAYHRSTLGMALVFVMFDAVRRALVARGVGALEMSWILEDNRGMRRILERIGGRVYKTYRIYEKPLP
jgi:hypothetical protein